MSGDRAGLSTGPRWVHQNVDSAVAQRSRFDYEPKFALAFPDHISHVHDIKDGPLEAMAARGVERPG